MRNQDIANLLDLTADLLEIQGANSFRIRAYRSAVRTIEGLTENLADVAGKGAGELTKLPGIGKDLAQRIVEIIQSGTTTQLDELREEVPAGVLDMLKLPGLGPKKVGALFHELHVTSLDELKQAAEEGRVSLLKGFAKKTEQSILENIDAAAQFGQRVSIAEAKRAAEAICDDLRQLDCVTQVEVAGSCRRSKETCGDLDILAVADSPTEIMDRLSEHELVQAVLQRGDTKQRVRLINGLEADLRVVPEESFGAAMQYFTGSKEHNVEVRRRAQERGLKLNEYGLFRGEESVAGRTEEDVYAALGLGWVPPELRENRGEIELAEANKLPKLVEMSDIRGDLHMHTTASDGEASILEMAQAAKDRGLSYIAITDHSKRASVANGLDDKRLLKHWKDIEKVRGQISGIEILKGIECDILEDATLDISDEVLAEADWVIAVIHYGLKQPRKQIMERLLNAIKNPYVCAIGHPSGRIVNKRQGADIDYPEFFQAAADYGVFMEINANPARLDLDDIHAAAARDKGIPIVINTDAHSCGGLDVMPYGVAQARRAGLEAKDVANTRTYSEFCKMLRTS
ncbi:MAG: DNA polymerase/3'-5' exonuclease PolX [Planctomycetaceae bacterium]|nr:DNA polymerase/3'-5' exonuclease PolX [Planctomycetaceae bacterium]MCB9952207.1 DNA polymerase/3'-5' exonuclease PolX [Planctomycetaceae bacterium]